jgi:hypothetical protein
VHDHGGLAVRIAADLPVDEVAVADVEHAVLVRFDRGIQEGSSHDGKEIRVIDPDAASKYRSAVILAL